jgi:hypothetical protein
LKAEDARPFVVNDPRLTFDAASHKYQLGDRVLPSVTQVLQATGLADFSAPWFTADCRDRGSLMHQAIALDVEGVLDDETLDPQLRPYLDGWRRFLEESRCEVERWETPVCDPALGYAGTLDGILRVPHSDARRLLVDIKRGFYRSAGPQTAAYKRLAWHFYTDQPVIFERAVVELSGDGRYQFHRLNEPSDERVFIAALTVHHWRNAA